MKNALIVVHIRCTRAMAMIVTVLKMVPSTEIDIPHDCMITIATFESLDVVFLS